MSGRRIRKFSFLSFFIFKLNNFIYSNRIELAVWTHSVASDIKPELLTDMPDRDNREVVGTNGSTTHTITESITSATPEQSDESNLETAPAATEQIEAVVPKDVEEKSQKPANGDFK